MVKILMSMVPSLIVQKIKLITFLSPWGEDTGEGESLNHIHPHPPLSRQRERVYLEFFLPLTEFAGRRSVMIMMNYYFFIRWATRRPNASHRLRAS